MRLFDHHYGNIFLEDESTGAHGNDLCWSLNHAGFVITGGKKASVELPRCDTQPDIALPCFVVDSCECLDLPSLNWVSIYMAAGELKYQAPSEFIAFRPSSTSSAIPPFPTVRAITLLIKPRFTPPLGGDQTPSFSRDSRAVQAC